MLDKKTYGLLKLFYRKKKLTFAEINEITGVDERKSPSKHISMLTSSHFISIWQTDKVINDLGDREWAGYKITLEGSAYVERHRQERRNFWVPYAITTFIAFLSLIASLAGNWDTILSWVSFCNPGS